MKRGMLCFISISIFIYSHTAWAVYSNDSTANNQSKDQNSNLAQEMDKKTKDALKIFKNLKFKDQSKQDFFDTVGQPTENSGFDGSGFQDLTTDDETFKINESSNEGMLGR
ncbi:hypothetical protein L3V86_02005 [Thiotrichales bacterium 19S11-10]|nr:hypothetical protein [Thiotrichales bacterium 19S11-10]